MRTLFWTVILVHSVVGAPCFGQSERAEDESAIGILASSWNGPALREVRHNYEKHQASPPVKYGVVVIEVLNGFPAEGVLKELDIIYKVEGKDVHNEDEFVTAMRSVAIGETVTMSIARPREKDGKISWQKRRARVVTTSQQKVTALIMERKKEKAAAAKSAEEARIATAKRAEEAKARDREALAKANRPSDIRTNGFRGIAWGSSPTKAKSTEKEELVAEKPGLLAFKGEIADRPALIGYVFVQDQLVRGKYAFTIKHMNKTHFLRDFDDLKTLISKKYEDPRKDDTTWLNDLYRGDPSQWGMAVSVGHLIKLCQWELADTTLSLVLTGDNFEIELAMEYTSRAHAGLEANAKEKRTLDDL